MSGHGKHKKAGSRIKSAAAKMSPQEKQALARQMARPTALVDVILPVFGEWSFAEKAIAALPSAFEGCNEPYRVIVVDNGTPAWKNEQGAELSPKDQAIGLRSLLRPQDAFFRLEENQGYPGGMNYAASRGSSPLILVLTADVWLHPGCVTKLIRDLDDPQVGIAAPMLIFPEGTPRGPAGRVQHAGVEFNMKGNPFHIFIGWTPDNPRVNKRCEVPAVTGACFLTRRSLWEKFGGFAAVYGAGTFEDMDYCFSVRSEGSTIIFNPEARGFHFVGASMIQGAQRGKGFNLPMNETIFRGHWAHMLSWTEWRRW